MRTYEVTVEGLVSRLILVESDNAADALREAKAEFVSLTGAERESVVVVDIFNEPPKFGVVE